MTDQKPQSDMITVATLYTNQNRAGYDYLAGNWGMARIFVFEIHPDRRKQGGPSHRLVFGERREQQQGGDDERQPQGEPPPERAPVDDSDIPF